MRKKAGLIFRRILYFFPFQLIFIHLKSSWLLLTIWVVLFGFVTQWVGLKYGIPYLFLFPEYLGEVNIWSHIILGFSVGGFIMAFNMYSYVMHGHLFPFIATLSRPFWKFSVNNSVIPLFFLITYVMCATSFQLNKELIDPSSVWIHMLGFLLGVTIFILLSFLYFFRTNKDIHRLGLKNKPKEGEPAEGVKGNVLHKKRSWFRGGERQWRVTTYLAHPFKVMLARDVRHYDKDLLAQIFNQNQINASLFEILMIASFIVLGTFHENPVVMIPAGASFVLVFTISLMLISAFYSWFKGWTVAVMVGLIAILNYCSGNFEFMKMRNEAYGLDYSKTTPYTSEALKCLRDDDETYTADYEHHLGILENWKAKNELYAKRHGREKPKLIFIATSGGGLRAALWTFHTLQHIDSATNHQLLRHSHMITGSSGGMIGAAYLRELQLLSHDDPAIMYEPVHREKIAGDMLNPIGFSIATNDIFIRYSDFEYAGRSYTKDRGYAFEKQLHKNTGFVLDKQLVDYAEPEANADVPMMIFAPTIVNDGRRMIIASQPVSFLSYNRPDRSVSTVPNTEDIEFRRFFADHEPDSVRFSSVLRMSATFPYILPIVTLPTEPKVEVMDAGLRDNYGLNTTIHYLFTYREWIKENTSGVIIVQVRDTHKHFEVTDKEIHSIADRLMAPAGSLYNNFTKIQDYNHDILLQYTSEWLESPLDVVTFELPNNKSDHVSLSWHLSRFEKDRIIAAIDLPRNQSALERVQDLLRTNMHDPSAITQLNQSQ